MLPPAVLAGSRMLRTAALAALGALAAPGVAFAADLLAASPDVAFSERLRAAIALVAAAVLTLDALLRGRRGTRRLRDALLAALVLATVFAWAWPYRSGFGSWFHFADAFHYYVGGKYFSELGYERLYHCSVTADVEAGHFEALSGSVIRDLATNRLEPVTVTLADPGGCKDHFSPERWSAFARDVDFFRRGLPFEVWSALRRDHGYNAPPAWGILGRTLTNTGPASAAQLLALTAIDPLLLAATFAAVAWAFGWRVACIALVFWGANQTARWEWVGGSILRFDWLAAAVGGICCLRRGRPQTAGLLLAVATCLRIFPALIAAGVGAGALIRMLRARSARPTPGERRFAVGFASGAAITVALSAWTAGGLGAWADFARNSRLHLATPSTNLVGLRSLVSFDPDQRAAVTFDPGLDDPFARWRRGRRDTFERRRALFALGVAGYAALLAFALWRRGGQPEWLAATLGVGAIPFAAQLSSYYLAILLVFAFLWARRPEVGAALMALAACSWWSRCGEDDCDVMFVWHSAAILLFVGFATWRETTRAAPSPRAEGQRTPAGQSA